MQVPTVFCFIYPQSDIFNFNPIHGLILVQWGSKYRTFANRKIKNRKHSKPDMVVPFENRTKMSGFQIPNVACSFSFPQEIKFSDVKQPCLPGFFLLLCQNEIWIHSCNEAGLVATFLTFFPIFVGHVTFTILKHK